MADHILYGIAVIGMFVPATKHRIDNEAAPIHLQRLKAFLFFAGGVNPVPAFCIVVVHHHGIDAQLDHNGFNDPQPPNEKGLQKAPEQKHARPGKRFEKPFHPFGRGHVLYWRLDATGITFILRKLVEVSQPPAGPINEKAKRLFEKFCNGKAFSGFADRTEPSIKPTENLNVIKIRNEQRQACPSGQPVGSSFHAPNFQFILAVIFAMFVHRVLHLLGVCKLVDNLVIFDKHYSMLSSC